MRYPDLYRASAAGDGYRVRLQSHVAVELAVALDYFYLTLCLISGDSEENLFAPQEMSLERAPRACQDSS